MQAEAVLSELAEAGALPPGERHARLSALHTRVLNDYLDALRSMTDEQAAAQAVKGEERRSVLQVVGHIAEWERFAIMGAADILAGVEHPRMVTDVEGYRDPDGTPRSFAGIDDFNAYQAERHAGWTWAQMRDFATETATTLHVLFTHPQLINASRLEATKPWRKRLIDGTRIPDLAMGWCLWMTVIEHEGAEHNTEIGARG